MPEWMERANELVQKGCHEAARVVTEDGLRGLWPDRVNSDHSYYNLYFRLSGKPVDERQKSDS